MLEMIVGHFSVLSILNLLAEDNLFGANKSTVQLRLDLSLKAVRLVMKIATCLKIHRSLEFFERALFLNGGHAIRSGLAGKFPER